MLPSERLSKIMERMAAGEDATATAGHVGLSPDVRNEMVRKLSAAYVGDPFAVLPLSNAIGHAVAKFEKLSDEELMEMSEGLNKIDQMAPVETHEIVWHGQDGTEDDMSFVCPPEELHH